MFNQHNRNHFFYILQAINKTTNRRKQIERESNFPEIRVSCGKKKAQIRSLLDLKNVVNFAVTDGKLVEEKYLGLNIFLQLVYRLLWQI